MPTQPTITSYSAYPPVFTRAHVNYLVKGGARVSWEIACGFKEPLPYTFQLQAGRQGLSAYRRDGTAPNAGNDWVDVGTPVVNTFYAVDTVQRMFGKTADLHYRVKLTTGNGGIYYSDPVNTYNNLNKRDWLAVREVIRKEALRLSKQVGTAGYLLKAVRYGPPCPTCVDKVTGEVTNSHCPVCYGTGFQGAYLPPFPTYAALDPESTREALNPQTNMSSPVTVKARMPAEPQVYALDVFVEKNSDRRHYVHAVAVAGQQRGVPVVMQVELRLAPYSDIVYSVPVGQ